MLTGPSSSCDLVVAKLKADGSALEFGTYLGGTGYSGQYSGVAFDGTGKVFVSGYTNGGFPVTSGAFQTTPMGNIDVFVAALNPTGTALVYATYLGGSGNEYPGIQGGHPIAVDGAGRATVVGYTQSTNFPTQNPIQGTHRSGGNWHNAFISQLSADGSALRFSTYLGGSTPLSTDDIAWAVALDSMGSIYTAGYTRSTDFPTSGNTGTTGIPTYYPSYQPTNHGNYDAWVAKLSPYAYPAAVTMSGGTPQSTIISTAFAAPLKALVQGADLLPIEGATVTFTAPGAGASGTFPGALTTLTAVTDVAGLATSPIFTANGTAGSYAVNATILDSATPAAFNLTNTSNFDTEPNNSYATAQRVNAPGTVLGSIGVNGDIDYFRLILPGRATVRATLTPPPGLHYFLYIYNQVGQIVAQSTLPGGATQTCWWTNPLGAGQYCYAVVRAPAGVFSASQPYSLTLNW